MKDTSSILKLPLEQRKEYVAGLLRDHPLRVPVILVGLESQTQERNRQILFPKDLSVTQFGLKIRHLIKLQEDDSLYFATNNRMLQHHQLFGNIYDQCKSEDGFLYIKVSCTPTFGNSKSLFDSSAKIFCEFSSFLQNFSTDLLSVSGSLDMM